MKTIDYKSKTTQIIDDVLKVDELIKSHIINKKK